MVPGEDLRFLRKQKSEVVAGKVGNVHICVFFKFFFFEIQKGRFSQNQRELGPNCVFLNYSRTRFFSVFKAHLAQSCGVLGGGHIFLFLAAWPFVVT